MHWLYFPGSIMPSHTRELCWCSLGYSHNYGENLDDTEVPSAQAA